MTALLPNPELQFVGSTGAPLAGGTLGTYIPGTLTAKTTWQDANQTIPNANPIVLDSSGRCIVFGSGDYRFILKDSSGNLIFDQLTSSTLAESAISSTMAPIVGATSLQTARDLMGVSSAIQTAITNVQLMPGATGPTGPTGATGPQGPQGPAGAAIASTFNGSNPGFWKDNSSGFIMNFGNLASDSGGNWSVTFGLPFPNACISFVCTCTNNRWWANVTSFSTSGASGTTSSPLAGGSWDSGPAGVTWCAFGF